MPYARSIRSDSKLPGVKPDPGLLFDRKSKTGSDARSHADVVNSPYEARGRRVQAERRRHLIHAFLSCYPYHSR